MILLGTSIALAIEPFLVGIPMMAAGTNPAQFVGKGSLVESSGAAAQMPSAESFKLAHLLQGKPDSSFLTLNSAELEASSPHNTDRFPERAYLAQKQDSQPYQPLFIPQHRHQAGRKPFFPGELPASAPSDDPDRFQGSPGVTIGIPSGYGAGWRSIGVGLGLQSRTRFTDTTDGGVGIGVGFGNPAKTIGFQVGLGLVDLSDPLADGTISLKAHRLLPHDVAIALGASGVVTWGEPDGGSSIYGVVTKRFILNEEVNKPFSQITTTFGVGSGQFRSESAINNDKDTIGAFGSVAVRMIEPLSGIVEWTGQDLSLGLSIVPFRNIPLVITPAITDITGNAGDGARFIVGVGYGIRF
jgi:hypothetical protein